MQTVVETPDYLRDAKATGIADEERRAIVDHVAANPRAGDLIVGSGGARKLPFAAQGRGKSGGYRVVTSTERGTCRCSCSTSSRREIAST
jgi:hypothetical protein